MVRLAAAIFASTLFFVASVAEAAFLDIKLLPDGDSVYGLDYNSQTGGWQAIAVDPTANPDVAKSWYFEGAGEIRRTALYFDISKYTADISELISATLNIYPVFDSNNGYNILGQNVFLVRFYIQGANEYSLRPPEASEIIANIPASELMYRGINQKWLSVNVTNALSSDISANYNTSVFTIVPNNNTFAYFYSGDAVGYEPFLHIEYKGSDTGTTPTPEPASLLLMGVGAAGAAFMKLRRNKASKERRIWQDRP